MSKVKFIPRAKRKALEAKLATLEASSDEAKEIRGQLGWGEPTPAEPEVPPPPPPPPPKPVVKEAPTPKKSTVRKRISSAIKKVTNSKTS